MGLDDLAPFEPRKKIIEYILEDDAGTSLVKMNLMEFADETASESPAPGGGSISAYVGVLGVSLGTMVANLSAHKRGWEDQWEAFSDWAEQGQEIMKQLLMLVDQDTDAFNQIMAAFGLPKNTKNEQQERKKAIEKATVHAIKVPLQVMKEAHKSLTVIGKMAEIGNPNSVSDAGVGALCASTAVQGAYLNVKINAAGMKDNRQVNALLEEAVAIAEKTGKLEKKILKIVDKKIASNT